MSFPLHRLPDNARLHIIEHFDELQLIMFSLISNNTLELVQSFDLDAEILSVYVEDSLEIQHIDDGGDYDITFKMYEESPAGHPLVSLDLEPNYIIVEANDYPGNVKFKWQNPGISFKRLFEHLLSLIHYGHSYVHFCCNDEIFDTSEIRNLLPTWPTCVIERASDAYSLKIMDTFAAISKNLSIMRPPDLPLAVGIQNFDRLEGYEARPLDTLLIMNASDICTEAFSTSDANIFIRFWMRGYQPRMRKISIFMRERINPEKLLKGVQYRLMPEGIRRMNAEGEDVAGNIDIWNKYGVMATIRWENRWNATFNTIWMHVWQ